MPTNPFVDTEYTITKRLPKVSYEVAVERTREALAKEGFGILTEIDVKATFQKKLGVEWSNYIILGACNPPLAHRALSGELAIGALLPCNVVVAEENGDSVVAAIDPGAMFSLVKNEAIGPIAEEVKQKLEAALGAL